MNSVVPGVRGLALATVLAAAVAWSVNAGVPSAAVKTNPQRDAYYGDLHLHTSYSFDAYVSAPASVSPDEAYRFAKGEAVDYLGQPVRRREPLDFLAVTDHAENLGVFNELEDPDGVVSSSELGKLVKSLRALANEPQAQSDPRDLEERFTFIFQKVFFATHNTLPEALKARSRAAWAREIDFANRNYEPGRFTTFVAYEWSSLAFGSNLHRNVIFKGDSAPYPFTSLDSKLPEDLWTWLETIRGQGFEALAIPHNANASNGLMYDWLSSTMGMSREYALRRQANEPLSEIAQNKGASETHPLLSPNDEFADYEIYDFVASWRHREGRVEGSYLRDALSRGLVLQAQVGANPFKYGFVGGSDLHPGLSVSAQADYGGSSYAVNLGGGKPTPTQVKALLSEPGSAEARKTTAGNLTGVWAESNTRESIYEALRRRETFATSGTRLKFRFFGGWNFDSSLFESKDWVKAAYREGVPMGGDLPQKPDVAGPTFAIWVVKDANGANLDRAQIIKVWEDNGRQREKVFDVVWSGRRQPDLKTGKLPAVGATVDLKTGRFTNNVGATELETVWKDPEFDAHHFAAYYLRVLEIPTSRWSTLLAVQNGLPVPGDVPATTQQRGWSSPIWFTPTQK